MIHELRRAQQGLSLVETLVAVVILGIAFTAILGGMSTSILTSDVHRKEATSETILRSYAEAIKDPATPYVACPLPPAYSSPVGFSAPSGYAASVAAVAYWDPSTSTFGACPGSGDSGLQRISLQVASSDGRATERVDILKRKP